MIKKADRARQLDELRREINEAIQRRGFPSLSEGCRKVDFAYTNVQRFIRDGLPKNPASKTEQKLSLLGILDILRRRSLAG